MKYCLGFMFSPNYSHVALILKNRPLWQKGQLNGIGGKVNPNETPLDAMIREFYEETGYQTQTTDWNNFATINGLMYEVQCFTATAPLKELKTTTDEQIQIHPLNYLPYTKLIPNLLWLIPMACDGKVKHANIIESHR